MLLNQKIIVVLPAFNAASTVKKVYEEIDHTVVDGVLLIDDASTDDTVRIANELGIETVVHEMNRGYGANQKTCYREALQRKADIVVMLHPDYQYPPKLIPALAGLVASGEFDVALGSRILGGEARKRGMPLYKYVANRLLTAIQNLVLGRKLSEFHTGFRAYSRRVLEQLPLDNNSNSFVFDNQIIAQCVYCGFRIGEVSAPGLYHSDASSIGFNKSIAYGLGVLHVTILFILQRLRLFKSGLFRCM